jgi:hypothetical protein
MKNLILAGLVALVSWQAMAAGDCPLRKGGGLLASNSHEDLLVKGNVGNTVIQQQNVKPAVRGAGTDSVRR